MESPPTASGEKPMTQIITPGAPPPNPQVIAGDSTENAEDSALTELTAARIGMTAPARRVGLPHSRGRDQGCAAVPSVGQLGGVAAVNLPGEVVPWVLRVRALRAWAAKQCPARPLVYPEGPSLVTGPAPLPRSVLLNIIDLHQR
jgi:hypothetical protein